MPRKSPFLFLSPLSLYLSYFFSSSSPLFFSSPSFFLSYPPNLLFSLFVSPSHFLIFLFFIFLLFLSFFLSFIFSYISFSSFFSFLFPIWIASTEWSKSGVNFPPLSSIATCHSHIFFPYFHDFSFPIIS